MRNALFYYIVLFLPIKKYIKLMNILKYILIGFIQGLTEFLPISSSGHIVLFGSLFELDNLLFLSVVAHLGTLFAVVFCYRKRLAGLFCQFGCDVGCVFKHKKLGKSEDRKLYLNLIFATIPTVIIFLLFKNLFEQSFSTKTLIWGFLISAFFLVLADFKRESDKKISPKASVLMGLSQGLALLPGISRSGSTLVCGMLAGANKQEVLDFSFLMSIPIILASAVYEGVKLISTNLTVNWLGIFIVLITSFIFGIISIKLMLKMVNKNRLFYFSIYLILLSLIMLFFF